MRGNFAGTGPDEWAYAWLIVILIGFAVWGIAIFSELNAAPISWKATIVHQ